MINIKIPRRAEYRSFEDDPGACPRCGGVLVNEYQTYMLATRRGKNITDSFVVGGNFGWFCKSCPVVVLNRDEIGKMLSFGESRWNIGLEYVALGIVNLDAIPASKRHLPIGNDDNPVPLVEFQDMDRSENSAPTPSPIAPKSADDAESPGSTHLSRHRRRR